ncbi:protein Dr1 homolog isoform X2 [Cicer arietinum]|uniref:Protein Dr1 homolog isoform X2 n=1 Tax=Cicer arietinum TaxID=3827 RepID=A0A1S2YR30_CICAR|nr:protein Dr1 homolog isoform X2 [Cicer arietinum]
MRVVEGNGKRGLGSVCCPNRMRARTCSLILSNLLHKFIYQQPCFPSSLSSRISDLQLSLVSGSIMEPMDIVGKSKEDASLPKATMTKIIKEMLPPDVRVARDAQDLLIECCVEFINLISSESNEVCNREDKRTIAPEHVLKALQVLGFSEYIEEVYAAYEQHKLETMDSLKGGKWSNAAEMTEEEALAEQQRMFAEARARMNGGAIATKQPNGDQSLDT